MIIFFKLINLDNMDILPPEILLTIFSFLDLKSSASCALTCRYFLELLREHPRKKPKYKYVQVRKNRFTPETRICKMEVKPLDCFIYEFDYGKSSGYLTYKINLKILDGLNGIYLFRGGIHGTKCKKYESYDRQSVEDLFMTGIIDINIGCIHIYCSKTISPENMTRLEEMFSSVSPHKICIKQNK